MTNLEENEINNLQPISSEEYFGAGVAGFFIIGGALLIASVLGVIIDSYVIKVSKEFEDTVLTVLWIVSSAIPLWLYGRYQVKRVPKGGWKWGFWIAFPTFFLMAILTPFGDYPDMAMLRVRIIVGAVGTATSVISTWFYSK